MKMKNKGLKCSVEGCERASHAKGLCQMHWSRLYSYGNTNQDPNPIRSRNKSQIICSIEGCKRPFFGKGMCNMHYGRVRRGMTDMRPEPIPTFVKGSKWKLDDPRYKNKNTPCSVDGCFGFYYAKGFCRRHWTLNQKHGSPFYIRPIRLIKECSVGGCNEIAKAKGFCDFHYIRYSKGRPLDRPKGNKGSLNVHWNGGVSEYPDHWTMKKIRKAILTEANFTCKECGGKATEVHHKDENKSNHTKENLVPLCCRCHKGIYHSGKPRKTSKFIRLYGSSKREISRVFGIPINRIQYLHVHGKLADRIGIPPALDYQI